MKHFRVKLEQDVKQYWIYTNRKRISSFKFSTVLQHNPRLLLYVLTVSSYNRNYSKCAHMRPIFTVDLPGFSGQLVWVVQCPTSN